ncbi:MAG: class I SAM-dependent methyltransferase [Halobacteriaceae archaeon]
MRRFSAQYLREARAGMWEGDREALTPLSLADREVVLDVGCGTGAFTAVLREETDARVVGVDADPALLSEAGGERVAGDALRLPFADGAADLVVCQALLVNLPDPVAAVEEFARVSAELVAAVEPDNAAVAVDSTVEAEPDLAARARRAYIAGAGTDVTLGDASDLFAEAGLRDVETRTYRQTRRIDPPYSERAVAAARRKARGERLEATRETLLAGDLDEDGYERLRDRWRAMGRDVIAQMRDDEYRRAEVVPFHVTVGRVD